jgi:hypothetical protein
VTVRHCARPAPYYADAGREPIPARVGYCVQLPANDCAQRGIQHHAACVELHRGRALLVLCLHALGHGSSEAVDLVEVCLFNTLYMGSRKNANAAHHRYNTFMVLYPLGISSECWLVYQAIAPASQIDERLGYALWAILAIYVPGSYILFTHMLKQRRRIQKSA